MNVEKMNTEAQTLHHFAQSGAELEMRRRGAHEVVPYAEVVLGKEGCGLPVALLKYNFSDGGCVVSATIGVIQVWERQKDGGGSFYTKFLEGETLEFEASRKECYSGGDLFAAVKRAIDKAASQWKEGWPASRSNAGTQ